ncbi:ion transporter [Paraferrimonas sedimenticola]|uniref:ion transporter n=1 Tax=Paraferrimonas sedimenticola TaxID=375674 RepID=UPI003CCBE053
MTNQKLQDYFFRLRSNKVFEMFVVSVIIFSALMVGAKTYELPPVLLTVTNILDWTITFIFMAEITVRFIGEPRKRDFFKNGWNVFDTLIVLVSVIPIDNSDMAVIGRLVRIFRVLRMISIIPELRTLLNSLLKALPQLGYVMLMMFIIFYIYAAIGSTFFAKVDPFLWGDISISMLTLFRVMTFEDWTDVMYDTMEVYPLSWIYYFTFICLTAFAFLNMVIGIVVSTLEEEHRLQDAERAEAEGEPTLKELQAEIQELKALIKEQHSVR